MYLVYNVERNRTIRFRDIFAKDNEFSIERAIDISSPPFSYKCKNIEGIGNCLWQKELRKILRIFMGFWRRRKYQQEAHFGLVLVFTSVADIRDRVIHSDILLVAFFYYRNLSNYRQNNRSYSFFFPEKDAEWTVLLSGSYCWFFASLLYRWIHLVAQGCYGY